MRTSGIIFALITGLSVSAHAVKPQKTAKRPGSRPISVTASRKSSKLPITETVINPATTVNAKKVYVDDEMQIIEMEEAKASAAAARVMPAQPRRVAPAAGYNQPAAGVPAAAATELPPTTVTQQPAMMVRRSSSAPAQQVATQVAPPTSNSRIVTLIPNFGYTHFVTTGTGTDDMTPITFVGGGLLADFGSRYFSLESGIQYLRGGLEYRETTLRMRAEIDYLGLPILGKFNFNGRVDNGFYARAGVMPSMVVNKYRRYQLTGNRVEENTERRSVHEWDTFGIIGAGGLLNTGSVGSFMADLSYFRGFLPIVKFTGEQYYNEGVMLSIGWGFGL